MVEFKMDFTIEYELSRNFFRMFKRICFENFLFFLIFVWVVLGLYICCLVLAFVRSLFLTIDIEIKSLSTFDNSPIVKCFLYMILSALFILRYLPVVSLNFVIFTLGALYDLFRFVATGGDKDMFFLRVEKQV